MTEIYLDIKDKLEKWQPAIVFENNQKVDWQLPTELEHGLFTTNIAFLLAKSLRQNPNQIAQDLKADLGDFLTSNSLPLESVQVGPYLNLKLKNEFFTQLIQDQTLSSPTQNTLKQIEKTVLLDYVGANVAKRLHVGHMRNLNLGEALRRLLKLKYSTVVTDNHWGDWGVQFGIIIWGWKQIILNNDFNLEIPQINIEDYENSPVETLQAIYVWGNTQEKLVENWKDLVRDEFLKLEKGDSQNRDLWEKFVNVSKAELKADLDLFKVPMHDLEQGESFYEPDMASLTEYMDQNNIWSQEDVARYFDFDKLSESWTELDEIQRKEISKFGRAYLISSNGYTSYCYRDTAARWQWARDYQADLMISIVDKTQKHNFDQAFSIICYLASRDDFKVLNQGFEGKINELADPRFRKPMNTKATISRLKFENLVHVGYGFLSLPEGKMSTRKGTVIILKDLVNQVQEAAKENLKSKNSEISEDDLKTRSKTIAIAALKWFDLNRDSWADIILDIPQILQFEGNTGVYQLYTYARLRRVREKGEIEAKAKKEIPKQSQDDTSLVQSSKSKVQSEEEGKIGGELNMSFRENREILEEFSGQISPVGRNDTSFNDLFTQAEKLIIQQMYTLPETLDKAVLSYKPHLICNHLYSLCDKINSWYNSTPILKEENEDRKAALLLLVEQMTDHIKFALDLLAIEVLEEI